MNDQKIIESLKKIALLASFTEKELIDFKSKLHIDCIKKNEPFIHEGDFNNYMFMILSGKVKISITNSDGKNFTVALRKTGEFFGDL